MAVQISGNDITVPRDGTFSRNVSIAGTLTYEDVTNVDSIGLVTARNGIEVGASPGVAASISVDGNAIFSGITTIGGNVKVGTGITLSPDGDGFYTGVVTATSYYGDGSNLSNITSTTINTNADNRVITGSGSANTLNGESNLTFDGTNLKVGNTFSAHAAADNLVVGSTSGSNGMTILTGSATGNIFFNNGSANNGVIQYVHSSDPDQMIINSDGQIEFDAGGSERLRIESDGDVRLSYGDAATNYGFIRGWDSSTGNMIIGADQSATGTSGSNLIFRTRGGERARILHSGGITFNGDTATANALDDYEEGTYTPRIIYGFDPDISSNSSAYQVAAGYYRKIGTFVEFNFYIQIANNSTYETDGNQIRFNLPVTQDYANSKRGHGIITYHNINGVYPNSSGTYALYVSGSTAESYDGSDQVKGGNGDSQANRYFIGGGNYHAV